MDRIVVYLHPLGGEVLDVVVDMPKRRCQRTASTMTWDGSGSQRRRSAELG